MNLRDAYPFRALVMLAGAIFLQAAGNLALAKALRDLDIGAVFGADDLSGSMVELAGVLGANLLFWFGLLALLAFFALFAVALNGIDLSFALPIVSLEIVLNVALAAVVLGEEISSRRWIGVGLVALGVALVAATGGQSPDARGESTRLAPEAGGGAP